MKLLLELMAFGIGSLSIAILTGTVAGLVTTAIYRSKKQRRSGTFIVPFFAVLAVGVSFSVWSISVGEFIRIETRGATDIATIEMAMRSLRQHRGLIWRVTVTYGVIPSLALVISAIAIPMIKPSRAACSWGGALLFLATVLYIGAAEGLVQRAVRLELARVLDFGELPAVRREVARASMTPPGWMRHSTDGIVSISTPPNWRLGKPGFANVIQVGLPPLSSGGNVVIRKNNRVNNHFPCKTRRIRHLEMGSCQQPGGHTPI